MIIGNEHDAFDDGDKDIPLSELVNKKWQIEQKSQVVTEGVTNISGNPNHILNSIKRQRFESTGNNHAGCAVAHAATATHTS